MSMLRREVQANAAELLRGPRLATQFQNLSQADRVGITAALRNRPERRHAGPGRKLEEPGRKSATD